MDPAVKEREEIQLPRGRGCGTLRGRRRMQVPLGRQMVLHSKPVRGYALCPFGALPWLSGTERLRGGIEREKRD